MKKIRVLVAEDEMLIQLHIVEILSELGCEIVGAVDTGQEAIDTALHESPDVIFMDIKLQGAVDGYEAARRIAADSTIPIVFMSAYNPGNMEKACDKTNCIGTISKPINTEMISEMLEMLDKQ